VGHVAPSVAPVTVSGCSRLTPIPVGPYATAVIATSGALLGGAIAAGSNLLVERSRRQHADVTRHEERFLELRQAARIVLEELNGFRSMLRETAKLGSPWPPEVAIDAWQRFGDVLAARVGNETWRMVGAAYDAVTALSREVREQQAERNVSTVVLSAARLRQAFVTVDMAMGPTRERARAEGRRLSRHRLRHGRRYVAGGRGAALSG
jgi:hypothetical protein